MSNEKKAKHCLEAYLRWSKMTGTSEIVKSLFKFAIVILILEAGVRVHNYIPITFEYIH